MLQPLGFKQQSIFTGLGEMVYVTDEESFWRDQSADPNDSLPKLVFLHGFGGGSSAYEWSKVYPAFADEYHILAPDLIGWGSSEHPPRNYRVDDYLTTITEFLEKACDEPVTVIASSLTAAFIVRIAVTRPELFKSLILVAPAGLEDFGSTYSNRLFTQVTSTVLLDRLFYFTGVANELAIRVFLEQQQFSQPQRISSEIVNAYLKSAQQPNADYSALSFVRGDLSFDLSQYIEQLAVPTAILWGSHSKFTGPNIGKRFAEMNPEAIQVFQIIDDVGLTPQLELPALTIGLIRKYLKLLQPLT
ncbi:MAG: alpha/beta hydrolase [Cyanobacteria bacterium P01_D01_bin.56]